eukprot:g7043.t1
MHLDDPEITAAQIAEKLGKPTKTVKNYISNAKKKLVKEKQKENEKAGSATSDDPTNTKARDVIVTKPNPKGEKFSKKKEMGGNPMESLLSPQAWLRSLSAKEAPEWLVDCYRMRVDDDYAWGGGDLHGLYEIHDCEDAAERASVVCEDFLVFLKAGVRNGAAPKAFNWRECVGRHAPELLPYAFEKSDAKEKWGGENVFSALVGGGKPSLRMVGEQVTGCGVQYGSGQKGNAISPFYEGTVSPDDIRSELRLPGDFGSVPSAVFDDVGGKALWMSLFEKLEAVL